MLHNFLQELRPMLRLAVPLVLAELGWMLMSIVDTLMVGRVSPEAIGAVGVSAILFYTVAIFGSGLMLGLDTLVSQSFGARRFDDCHRSLVAGIWLALIASPVLMAIVWLWIPFLRSFGIHAAILREAIPYLEALNWSTLPLLLYSAFRRYLQAINLAKPVMFALITANLVNVFVNWMLIFGNLGAPAMGTEGAGWATTLSRIYMAGVLLAAVLYYDRRDRTGLLRVPLRLDPGRLGRVFRLGFPAAMQIVLEVGVFAAATALIARLDLVSPAAHQIALNCASVTYMVPLGLASAGAVRVGQALGRGDPAAAGRAGWTALAMGVLFMSCAAVAFLLVPRPFVRMYTADPAVIAAGIVLLRVAAFFQLFDGLQAVATGNLRGAGDTRTPMICHLTGYWFVGLPLGYYFCFRFGWGATGIWIGLCIALILIGVVLLGVWWRKSQSFRNLPVAHQKHA